MAGHVSCKSLVHAIPGTDESLVPFGTSCPAAITNDAEIRIGAGRFLHLKGCRRTIPWRVLLQEEPNDECTRKVRVQRQLCDVSVESKTHTPTAGRRAHVWPGTQGSIVLEVCSSSRPSDIWTQSIATHNVRTRAIAFVLAEAVCRGGCLSSAFLDSDQ